MLHLMTQQPLDALGNALQMILFCGFLVVLGLTPMVAFDVFYQLWSHFKKLKMTKQDIRDEFKDQEGIRTSRDAFASSSGRSPGAA